MFCRFCGAQVLEDSVFCAKCGKRLRNTSNPRLERISKRLYLRTPYPYAALLVLLVATLALWTAVASYANRVDYAQLVWALTEDRKLDLPESQLYQQQLSLVVENMGDKPVRDIPVDLMVSLEPAQPAEIIASFRGSKWAVMLDGKVLPLTLILSDEVAPGNKRSFRLEGAIKAQSPFKATYTIREEGSDEVLAQFVVSR